MMIIISLLGSKNMAQDKDFLSVDFKDYYQAIVLIKKGNCAEAN